MINYLAKTTICIAAILAGEHIIMRDKMNPPKLLYHYTNANGLLGMIKSKKIWASSYRYMNDSQEFEYGFDLIEDIYPKSDTYTYSLRSNLPDQSFAEHLRLKKWDYKSDCLFVASFSEEENLLGQWRAYTGPHSGYAIGFKKNELKNDVARLVKCEYDKEKQKSVLKDLIDKDLLVLRESFEKTSEDRDKKEYPDLADYFINVDMTVLKIVQIATSFKHKSFSEEKEWRLVIGPVDITSDRILYRPSDTGIIPYIEIDFTDKVLPIECIIVGPGPHQKRNEVSLRQMLSITGFNNVDVSLSDIPYRNW